MPTIIDGTLGLTTPTYGGADTAEYIVPVTAFKNRIINGAMQIDQRNAGASVSNIGNGAFITDRFFYDRAGLGITAQFTASQSTDAPTGFQYSAKLDTTTAQTLGATGGTYFGITHKIEGFNMANMANNAATLSFWVKATKTGTYSVVFKNSGNDRSYVGEYTVSSSNTWEYKTITISSITTAGTWNYTNGVGLSIFFCVAVADDVATSTIGSWISSNVFGSVNNVEGADNTANDFLISGVQLEVGSTATSFDYRPYGTELALCQRYFYQVTVQTDWGNSSNYAMAFFYHPVQMRVSPTRTAISNSVGTLLGGELNSLSATQQLSGVSSVQASTVVQSFSAEL